MGDGAVTDRPRDEHNRLIYKDREILPEDAEGFSVWRGRLVHPDRICTTVPAKQHGMYCDNGWIKSGDWLFHCGTCRPHRIGQEIYYRKES